MTLQNTGSVKGSEGALHLQQGPAEVKVKVCSLTSLALVTDQGGCDQTDEFCSLPNLGKKLSSCSLYKVATKQDLLFTGMGVGWDLCGFCGTSNARVSDWPSLKT